MDDPAVFQTSTYLVLNSFNGQLDLEQTSIPRPTPFGSVVVRVLSTPVRNNHRAVFHGKGLLSYKLPYHPGDGCVGRVISIGPDVVALEPGELVYMSNFITTRDPNPTVTLGFWRDVAIVPAENAVPLDEMTLVHVMGYSYGDLNYIQRLSVAYGSIRAANLQAGDTVIVAPANTGSFSGAIIELAVQIGCKVIAISHCASRLEPLTSRFPHVAALELIGDEKKDTEAIHTLAPQGVNAYIDISLPASTEDPHHLTVSINSLSRFGRVVFSGMMSNININYAGLMARNITITAKLMYTREELVSLIEMIEGGVIKLGKDAGHRIVERGYRLDEWEEAVTAAETAVGWGEQVLFCPSEDVME